jgi:hypothetical protein
MDPTLLQSKIFLIACAAVVVVAGLAVLNTGIAWRWWRAGKDIGSTLEFKYLHPKEIRPGGKYPFLLFISTLETGEPIPDKEPDVVEVTIQHQIERLLHHNLDHYRENNINSSKPVPKNRYLKLKVKAEGDLRFDPPDTTRLHDEELVIQHFRLIADESLEGKTARVVLKVSNGWVQVAEFGFEIRVTSKAKCEPFDITSAPVRRDIFPSYAHEDAEYLEHFKKLFAVFGDEYLADVDKIRAGTFWKEEIESLIRNADLFQLFWTHNAAKSDYVPIEVKYALSLNRRDFIYQTIFEKDAPPLLAAGADIQTAFVSLKRKKVKKNKDRKAFLFAPLMAATGSSASAAVPALTMAGGVLALSVAMGLGTHALINTTAGPGPGPEPTPAPTVEQPSPSPGPTPSPTPPPPIAAVSGQVLVSNEGRSGVEVMLCAQRSHSPKPECTSTKTDRGGSFSFPTVDKALRYYVAVADKDWICDPQAKPLTDLSVPQTVPFVCRPRDTASPSPTTSVPANVVVHTELDIDKITKRGQVVTVLVRVTNEGGETARRTNVKLSMPEFVNKVSSTVEFKESRDDRRRLILERLIPSMAAAQVLRWEIKIVLNRDLRDNERIYVSKLEP